MKAAFLFAYLTGIYVFETMAENRREAMNAVRRSKCGKEKGLDEINKK